MKTTGVFVPDRSWRTWETRVQNGASDSYEVIVLADSLDPANPELSAAVSSRRVFVLIDATVEKLYGEALLTYLRAHRHEVSVFAVEASEEQKNLSTAESFLRFCLDRGMGRRDTVLCMGGGIICDVGALAASLIRRGAPCVKVPTTLLGMIDGAIGVKNGVNFNGTKNSVGSYSLPRSVMVDLGLLRTLPKEQMGFGMIEMAKMVALKSREDWDCLRWNFDALKGLRDMARLSGLVCRSIRYMLDELESNLFEKDLFRIVDYGHEFGHTIEVSTGYAVSHGEAVLAGMCLSNTLCWRRGMMKATDYEDFWDFAANFDLPTLFGRISLESLVESLQHTELHKGETFMVALQEIGRPLFLRGVTPAELGPAWDECRGRTSSLPARRAG